MSRCFPYPPPHFRESLIESIKIYKEQEKASKEAKAKAKEQKKEKKREKKEKKREKVNQNLINPNQEEKSHKKRKYDDKKSLPEQKELFGQKTINDAVEQLEGSGLTEEHEMPCSIKYKHDSPESSQDSNKRRKVVPSSSTHSAHASVLRIKLSASKQAGDSSSQLQSTSRQGGDPGSLLQSASRQGRDSGSLLQSTSRQGRDSGSLLQPTSRQGRESGSLLQPTSRQGKDSGSLLQPTSRQGKDSGTLVQPTSRQGKDSGTLLQPTLPHGVDLAPHLPTISRREGDSCSQLPSTSRPKPGPPLPSSRHKDREPPTAQTAAQVAPPAVKLMQLAHDQPAVDQQPCFSGRGLETASNQEVIVPSPKKKSSSSKRVGGRTWQKEQFKDLVENWKSPSLQLESSDPAEEWLVVAPKKRTSNNSSVVCVEGSEHGAAGNNTIPSQQPRACYIPELDMYQLPYVVPF